MKEKIKATDLFSGWAEEGKDQRMAKTHLPSVQEMIDYVITPQIKNFTFIDAGCGNGWVVRKVAQDTRCRFAAGVDGAKKMIKQASTHDPNGNYYCNDLLSWNPEMKVDIVHSMEVLYYFKDPLELIKKISHNWLKSGGKFISGVDFYLENPKSHSWPKDLNVHMTLLSEDQWLSAFTAAGFKNCYSWLANKSNDFNGTLCIYGELE